MKAVWPDENKPTEFFYEMRPDEGELLCRLLGKLSRNDLVEFKFTDEEIDKIYSIYSLI